jgi:hypothetical protein
MGVPSAAKAPDALAATPIRQIANRPGTTFGIATNFIGETNVRGKAITQSPSVFKKTPGKKLAPSRRATHRCRNSLAGMRLLVGLFVVLLYLNATEKLQ